MFFIMRDNIELQPVYQSFHRRLIQLQTMCFHQHFLKIYGRHGILLVGLVQPSIAVGLTPQNSDDNGRINYYH